MKKENENKKSQALINFFQGHETWRTTGTGDHTSPVPQARGEPGETTQTTATSTVAAWTAPTRRDCPRTAENEWEVEGGRCRWTEHTKLKKVTIANRDKAPAR